MFQENNIYTWLEQYLSEDEKKKFFEMKNKLNPKQLEEYQTKWAALFEEVKQHLNSNPASNEAQELAKKWLGLINEPYQGHSNIDPKLWETFKAGSTPNQTNVPYYDDAVITFISRAIDYVKENGHV